jgi:hypothetical protein
MKLPSMSIPRNRILALIKAVEALNMRIEIVGSKTSKNAIEVLITLKVSPAGVEPATYRLGGGCSIH